VASEPEVDETPEMIRLEGVLADRDRWDALRCPVDRALSVVGTRSAVLLMREAYYGARRFDDFASRVGISDAVAATRLRELVSAGLLQRQPYREPGQRTRSEYVLTAQGRDFLPVFLALMDWGGTYLSDPTGPPLSVRHRGCGEEVHVEVRCGAGHRVTPGELSVRRSS
jgi:DNA-binding HxlR family transcriptional regulator